MTAPDIAAKAKAKEKGVHNPGQAADRIAAGHADVDQAEVANLSVPDIPEQADPVLRGPVDEQVGQGMAVALEEGREGITVWEDQATARVDPARVDPDGRPAGAIVPVGVVLIDDAAPIGVEIQVCRQLVAAASAPSGTPHAQRTLEKRRAVRRPVRPGIRPAVTVQVIAQNIELRQRGDLDEAVVVDIVVPVSRRDRD